ncbi:MAG TPA: efflux RND transporter permease subunit, partial [Candidatus Binatus sp.]|nr:efflux RND transporter permease subunit [Candidatus Binatus sp.]
MDQTDQHDGSGDHEHDLPARVVEDRQQAARAATPGVPPQDTPGGKLIQVTGSGLSGPFIRRPVMTVLLTLSVIVAGIATYNKLAVNDLPAVDYPVIQVTCAYPGAN